MIPAAGEFELFVPLSIDFAQRSSSDLGFAEPKMWLLDSQSVCREIIALWLKKAIFGGEVTHFCDMFLAWRWV
jgi:hypothetical protein